MGSTLLTTPALNKYSVNTLLLVTWCPLSSVFGPVIHELCDLGSVYKFLKNSVSSFAKFALCHYKNTLYWMPKSESCSVVSNFWDTLDSTAREILQARILEWITFPFSRGSFQPRDQTQVCHIAGGFFTSWAIGKPKNTRVGSLSLLQWIVPTKESNWGLLHCRRILYQMSYRVNSEISSFTKSPRLWNLKN